MDTPQSNTLWFRPHSNNAVTISTISTYPHLKSSSCIYKNRRCACFPCFLHILVLGGKITKSLPGVAPSVAIGCSEGLAFNIIFQLFDSYTLLLIYLIYHHLVHAPMQNIDTIYHDAILTLDRSATEFHLERAFED